MSKHTQGPWMAVTMDGGRVVLDTDGAPVCALPDNLKRSAEEMAANAELIALAPELFRSVGELVAMMRASDVEKVGCGITCDSDDWDAALEEAQALLDLLAEDKDLLDDVTETDDSLVVIPVPMMQPPVVVTAFKAGNGDVAFIVHADDEMKTFIGQYGIAPPLFAWARSSLTEDGPLCGVLRDGMVVGEIGFYPGRILKVMIGEQAQSVELAQKDIDDIVSLFGEH